MFIEARKLNNLLLLLTAARLWGLKLHEHRLSATE